MRLRAKLLTTFLSIAIIVVISGAVGVAQIWNLAGAARAVSDDATPHLYGVLEARLAVFEADVGVQQIIAGFLPVSARESVERDLDRAGEYLAVLIDGGQIGEVEMPPVPDGEIKDQIERMTATLADFRDISDERITGFASAGRTDLGADGAYRIALTLYTDLAATASDTIIDELKSLSDQTQATARRGIILLALTTLAGLVASVLFALTLANSVVNRLQTVMEISARLARGDFSATLEARGADEIADLSTNIAEVITSLDGIIGTVVGRIHVLEETRSQLATSTATTSTTVLEMAGQMDSSREENDDLAANVTQTTAIIEEMARSIEALNNSVQQQASAIEESSASIEQMIASIENIASISTTARQQLGRLDSASEASRQVLEEQEELVSQMSNASDRLLEANELIAGVTEQTDLLAMNAAIEAAHAGDAGRGFAVVADEIRKLAEMTGEQSRQVDTDIASIRNLIGRLVVGSRTSNEGFSEIQSALADVQNVFQEINEAMQEQRSGGSEILDALRQMRDLTTTVNDGSSEMRAGNEQMLTAIRNVNEITQRSRESIRRVNDGITRISGEMEEIKNVSERNTRQVAEIMTATDRITLSTSHEKTAGTRDVAKTDNYSTGLMPADGEVVPSYLESSS